MLFLFSAFYFYRDNILFAEPLFIHIICRIYSLFYIYGCIIYMYMFCLFSDIINLCIWNHDGCDPEHEDPDNLFKQWNSS